MKARHPLIQMNRPAMGYTRVALAIAVAAVVVAVAILGSSALGVTRTVTSTSIVATTSTITNAASTVTDVVVSNHTVTMNVTEGQPYALLVNPDATVRGGAVSIPGCAVHGGCTQSVNQSSTAILILYDGSYYYVSNYTIVSQYTAIYTVWYTNSTEYCVSPEVSGDSLCPNAVFVPENPTQTQTQTTQSVSCTVTGEGGPLFLEVVTDQGVPVQSQQIQVIHTGPTVDGQPCGTASLPTLSTNSTGWVQVPGGDGLPYAGSFAVSFAYSGQTYNATVVIQPETTTYVTFYVPSGVQATTQCLNNSCPTYTNSMSMDS
jgi:hypothetical protein